LQAEAVALVQSACFKHWTHCSAVLSQKGFALSVQSGLSEHSTHVLVVESQAGFGAAHCDLSVHSTQVFDAVLQTGVVPAHAPSHGVAPAAPA